MAPSLDLKSSLTLRVVAVALFCFVIAAAVALFGTYRDVRQLNEHVADVLVREIPNPTGRRIDCSAAYAAPRRRQDAWHGSRIYRLHRGASLVAGGYRVVQLLLQRAVMPRFAASSSMSTR